MKRLSLKPDPHMAWIYDNNHPDYNSDLAKDLREKRRYALLGAPDWMIRQAEMNDCQDERNYILNVPNYGTQQGAHQMDTSAAHERIETLLDAAKVLATEKDQLKDEMWVDVNTKKPKTKRGFAVPVLIWPRDPMGSEQYGVDGHAYYGNRATGKPEFYKFGSVIHGVTYWAYMPEGPNAKVTPTSIRADTIPASPAPAPRSRRKSQQPKQTKPPGRR